ncbi:MAG: GAF domain-containing protein, partial [Anaerolineae bacterium]
FYETTSCNGPVGSFVTMSGGTLLATSPSTDFTFIRLANDPSDGQGFAGWVMTKGQSLNITDSQTDPRYYREIDRKTGIFLRSILTVPLKVKDRMIGVIQVVDTEMSRFDDHDQMLVESLATAAAAAIENARLYEQAAQDARTKSLLLEEVNHRVKNNLAAIIGLLYAEQRQLVKENRPELKNVLQEMITRIQGLATVHRMLSASEWSPLALGDLVMQVIRSVVATSQHGRLAEIRVSPSQTRVVAAQANSLALVINVLTTNSLKYALPAVNPLVIEVTITENESATELTYQDNGPGFPEDVITSGQVNVGLYLVKTLVQEDLMGSATLANEKGAVITIRFQPSAS